MENTRFDGWSPLIPARGQAVQVKFGQDEAYDVVVRSRMTKDGETFFIVLDWPWSPAGILVLKITPNASAQGMVDQAADLKPWWRTVPQDASPAEQSVGVKLFFLE